MDKLEKEVMTDAVLLYLEKINLEFVATGRSSEIGKRRFNMALDIAKKFDLDILDWESERKEVSQ
jgi:hypothetical protein